MQFLSLYSARDYADWIEVRGAVLDACKSLAGVCDGAKSHDGAGFNKVDSEFGKSLAALAPERATPKQIASGLKMIQKYKKTQLSHLGINWENLRVPTPKAEPIFDARNLVDYRPCYIHTNDLNI